MCTITINSSEETELFQKNTPNFNHVELVKPDSNTWFQDACASGVKCDVLMISGHFGGSFFGKVTQHSLSSNTLETLSCQNSCPGILRNPKEVYLFGCNTLAGKTRDHRTPQEYVQVLMRDGFEGSEAQTLAAIRYSPMGNSFRDKLTRSFAGVPRIYGFDSVGPSGSNIKKSLDQYFLDTGSYERYLESANLALTNTIWSKNMRHYAHAQEPGADVRQIQSSFACKLQDEKLPNHQKLNSISELFNDELQLLANIEYLDYYFQNIRFYGTSVQNHRVSELESMIRYNLMSNTQAKNLVEKYLQKELPGLLSLQTALLNIGKELGWWTQNSYDTKIKTLFGDFTRGIKVEHADIICSRNIHIPGLRLENFKSGDWGIGEFKAIACLEPKDARISNKLASYLLRVRRDDVRAFFLLMGIKAVGEKTPNVETSVATYFKGINFRDSYTAVLLRQTIEIIAEMNMDCKNCDPTLQFLLSKKDEAAGSDYKVAYDYAFLYLLNRTQVSAHIVEGAVRQTLLGTSALFRVHLQTNRNLCSHLASIKRWEDQYLPRDARDWSYTEIEGNETRSYFGWTVDKAKMLVSDDLEKVCN